jgi:hypothetical protein
MKMEKIYITVWDGIKDELEETGEVIDNMKVYRIKNPKLNADVK